MTGLLTRIRAHVAQIPTHYCYQCGFDVVSADGACPRCKAPDLERIEGNLHPAEALLREVAALEPAGYIWPAAVHVLKAHEQRYEFLWAKPTGQADLPLYALTGGSHDPE